MENMKNLASSILDQATRAGATAAEVYLRRGAETEIEVRDGQVETLQQGRPQSVGLRLWRGDRSASTYSTDWSRDALARLIGDTLDLAALTDPVPELAIAPAAELVREVPALDLFDGALAQLSADQKLTWLREAEEAGRAHDSRITVSGGAGFSDVMYEHVLATSNGLLVGHRETFASIGVQLLAGDAEGKKRPGSWASVSRHLSRRQAGEPDRRRAVLADR